jgi:hypothetical protein
LTDVALLVDRIVTVDYGGRGVVQRLYDAAYRIVGQPLCLSAARVLDRCRDGSVLVSTGFRLLRYGGVYETDGIVSTSLLSWALIRYLGAEVAVMVDEGFGNIFKALAWEAGVGQSDPLKVVELPLNRRSAEERFRSLMAGLRPAAMVAVERPGANSMGVYHNSRGQDISHLHAVADRLIEGLRLDGVPLIAVGDGGNEAGMAVVSDVVEQFIPYGGKCVCGCGGGIAAATGCDHPVIASISDLGVYGVLAHLLPLDGFAEIISKVERVMRAAVGLGCADAFHGPGFIGVDGVDHHSIKAVLGIIKRVVE